MGPFNHGLNTVETRRTHYVLRSRFERHTVGEAILAEVAPCLETPLNQNRIFLLGYIETLVVCPPPKVVKNERSISTHADKDRLEKSRDGVEN